MRFMIVTVVIYVQFSYWVELGKLHCVFGL